MALTSNVHDVALIFEGGGMRASYTTAVVTVLLEAGIHIDHVSGISAGSSNTANYVSRDAERGKRSFVDFAADPQFGNMRTFLRGQGMFNSAYIYEGTSEPGQALPFDFATFVANPARVQIGALRARDGAMVYWGKEDFPTMLDMLRRVRASSSMPILMPPVTIDGEVYVDGALGPSGGIPLDAARAAGFTRFLVVMTRERAYTKPAVRFQAPYRRHFRRYPAVADALIARPRSYAATRAELLDLEADGDAVLFFPDRMPVANGERNVAKLQASYELGLAQARRDLPKWRDFLGL